MNQAFLFMNWVIDHSSMQSPQELRDLLTPQLWEDFLQSEDAISNTISFVQYVKDTVVDSLDKRPAKKPRVTKSKAKPVPVPAESGEAEIVTPIPEEEEGVKKPVKKPRSTKSKSKAVPVPVPAESGETLITQEAEVVTPIPEQEEGVKKPAKKPRSTKSKAVPEVPQEDATQVILPNDDFQEIQLQLVHLDGQPAFIDNQNNIFEF